jgi:hypothetical protein
MTYNDIDLKTVNTSFGRVSCDHWEATTTTMMHPMSAPSIDEDEIDSRSTMNHPRQPQHEMFKIEGSDGMDSASSVPFVSNVPHHHSPVSERSNNRPLYAPQLFSIANHPPPRRWLLRGQHKAMNPPPKIHVSHGCLLIPVVFAAWWYYTRRMCRNVVRGFLRATPEPTESELFGDKFTPFEEANVQWYVRFSTLCD